MDGQWRNELNQQVERSDHHRLTRRTVLKLSVAAAGLLVINGVRRFLGYQELSARTRKAVLEEPVFYPVNSVTAVPDLDCSLLRDEGGFYAISRVCTHLGCLVSADETTFSCPCHGSRFARDGVVVEGPANQPLQQVQVAQLDDGRLVIDADVVIPAGSRLQL
jgi:cytochrome b6-f complex iron-sulfur subunit